MSLWFCKLLIVCITTQICFTDQLDSHKIKQNSSNILKDASNIIYFLTLLPTPQPNSSDEQSGFSGSGVLSAAELAVQHVNKKKKILQGFTVRLINADVGGCNETIKIVTTFIEHVFKRDARNRSIFGIVGSTCSESTITLSSISGRAGLPMPIVHFASSAKLEDREKYPYTFGVLGSMFQIVKALFSFLHHSRVDKIAVVYEDSRVFSYTNYRVRELINTELTSSGGIVSFQSAFYDSFFPVKSLRESNAKIVVVISTLPLAQKIVCIAYHEMMMFPNYQWIITHSYNEFKQTRTRFHYAGRFHECNWDAQENHNPILNQVLFVNFRSLQGNVTSPLISGYTYLDIQQQYVERVCHNDTYSSSCPISGVSMAMFATTYDAVWTLALALNNTIHVIGDSVCMDHTVGFDNMIVNFQHVHFKGASGNVHFDNKTGFVRRFIDIEQIRDGKVALVGSVYNENILLYNDASPVFTSELNQRYASVNPFSAAFFVVIELILLVITVFIHIVSLVYRHYPSIKAASPVLNQFVFISCYLTILSALLYILAIKTFGPSDFHLIGNVCHALWAWLYPTIITLSVGVLLAKTWRIYRIFIHFQNPGPLISNKALFVIVLVQLTLDIIIGTAWSKISPIRATVVEGGSYVNKKGQIIIQRQCVFTNTTYWLVTLGAYKLIQIVLLLVLCILTRSVKDKRFSAISLTVGTYLTLLFAFILIPLYTILWYINAEIHADFVVLCVIFSGNCLLLLSFVLVPPIVPLLRSRIWRHK